MRRRRYRRQPIQKKSEGSDQFLKPKVQTKLSVGQPGDKYEVEADHMADQVVNNKSGDGAIQKKEGEEEVQQKPLASSITPLIQKMEASEEENTQAKLQRKEEEEPVQKMEEEESVQKQEEEEVQAKEEEEVQKMGEEEEVQAKEEEEVQKVGEEEEVQAKEEEEVQKMGEEEEVQAKCADCEQEGVQKKEEEEVQAKSNNPQLKGNSVEGKLRKGSGGQSMDAETQSEMESGFGADFSNVNIHTDAEAQRMSQDIGAQAFTHGNDIYFNEGKYDPNSKKGKHLLAHELTHTIQQKGMVQKNGVSKAKPNTIQQKASKPPKNLACTPGNSTPSGSGETLNFPVAGSSFTAEQQAGINNFVRNWHQTREIVRIDGYASVDGPEDHNWHLSCKRAIAAKQALMNPTDGSLGIPEAYVHIFAHGETSQFGSLVANRRVMIHLPSKPAVNPENQNPVLNHKTKFKAADGTADTRQTVGVGEEVTMQSNIPGEWTTTAGLPQKRVGAKTFTWTAPNRAASVSVTFTSGGKTVSKIFTVIEPDAITGTNKREIQYPPGTHGSGMFLRFVYHPLTVSFQNVETKEVSHKATKVEGYYRGKGTFYHDTGDTFFPVGPKNIDSVDDKAFQSGGPAPWSQGIVEWDIPNRFRVKTESGNGKEFVKVDQDMRTLDATGKSSVDKLGLHVDRTP